MNDQCDDLGPDYCMRVYYEQLILHPRTWLTKILKFLNLPWTENVMHHEQQIGKAHGISLSKVERSSDQVRKKIDFYLTEIPNSLVILLTVCLSNKHKSNCMESLSTA